MAGNLDFDPAKMKQGQAAVDTAHGEIKSLLTKLQGDVDSLMGGWKSSAATQFSMVHAKWADKTTQINKALDVMHQKLGATDRTFVNNETEQTQAFSALNRF